ncbi:MAG: DUF3060 domain-containing protein [Sphingopyxis sp.]
MLALSSPLILGLLLATPSLAVQHDRGTGTRDGSSVSGVDQAHDVDCGGRPAKVSGSGNRINFTGDCPGLVVSGVDNQVAISLRPGASIQVSGASNVISWRIAGGGKPRLTISGVDNQVRPER